MLQRLRPLAGALLRAPGSIASSAVIPHTATASTSYSAEADAGGQKALVNKLLYRSKQRGFLELDLLMGLWAEQEVPRMSHDMLHDFSAVLDEENPDLFKWLTSQLPAPDHVAQNPAFQALKRHVDQQMDQHSTPEAHAAAGADWVRGWDDSWRGAAAAAGGAGAQPGAAAEQQAAPH